jgi:PmbA protein
MKPMEERMPDLEPDKILDLALEILGSAPVEGGEVYFQDTHESSATVVDQRVESVEAKQERGAALRAFRDGRVGFSFTPDLSPEGIRRAVERAVSVLPHFDPDVSSAVPSPEVSPFGLKNADPALSEVTVEEKVDMARRIESCALRFSTRVKRVRESRYTDVYGGCWIANTSGVRAGYRISRAVGSIDLVAVEKGENQTGYGSGFGLGIDDLEPDAIGIEAASRAINKLGAEPAVTRRTDVVLDPDVVAGVFGMLAAAFHADNVIKGKSLFKDLAGTAMARPTVTLVDDGRFPGSMNLAPIDGEGTPTRRTVLIDRGLLNGFLHSHYTAGKMGVPRTGNAQRAGYLSSPHIGTTTLCLRPTGLNRKSLLGMVARGVYLSEVMGLHTIDPVTGDFSLGAVGWEMENGEMIRPLHKMGFSGNVREVLGALAAVADDVRLLASGHAGSTVLLEGISISGS